MAALAAVLKEQTLGEVVQPFDVHSNQIEQCRVQLSAGVDGIFDAQKKSPTAENVIGVKTVHAKVAEPILENGLSKGAITKAGLLSVKRC